jgi:ubiquinol-cytochrome c reductase cytochrome c1 subunit
VRRLFVIAATAALALWVGAGAPARAAEEAEFASRDWSFGGPFGTFDRGALRRGLQVYREVCATCHSLDLVAYRNLGDVGFSEDEVKAIAAEYTVLDGPNEEGEMYQRPALPADRFVAPFPNEQAARVANAGALPPDLSVITKARAGGPDYIFALLAGYRDPPEGVEITGGTFYNLAFPGNQIAMPPLLFEGGIEYADGTPATVEQMAEDVVTFLAWAGEPTLEARKRLGVKVMLFLIVFTALLYAVKREVWKDVH